MKTKKMWRIGLALMLALALTLGLSASSMAAFGFPEQFTPPTNLHWEGPYACFDWNPEPWEEEYLNILQSKESA